MLWLGRYLHSNHSPCTVPLCLNHGKHWVRLRSCSHFLFIELPKTDKNRDWTIPILCAGLDMKDAFLSRHNCISAAEMRPRYGCNHHAGNPHHRQFHPIGRDNGFRRNALTGQRTCPRARDETTWRTSVACYDPHRGEILNGKPVRRGPAVEERAGTRSERSTTHRRPHLPPWEVLAPMAHHASTPCPLPLVGESVWRRKRGGQSRRRDLSERSQPLAAKESQPRNAHAGRK